jgi:hypothetical protein
MKTPSIAHHRCYQCGATSYRQVIERDAAGAMRPTGRHRCTGCEVEFTTTREWRDGLAIVQPKNSGFGIFQPLTACGGN